MNVAVSKRVHGVDENQVEITGQTAMLKTIVQNEAIDLAVITKDGAAAADAIGIGVDNRAPAARLRGAVAQKPLEHHLFIGRPILGALVTAHQDRRFMAVADKLLA